MAQNSAKPVSRRSFLKTTGVTALAATAPTIIIPGRTQPKTLRILRPKELIDSINQWYTEFAGTWGEQNAIQVIMDAESQGTSVRQTKDEFTAEQGHDLYCTVPVSTRDSIFFTA